MEYLQCVGLEISFALKEKSQEDKSLVEETFMFTFELSPTVTRRDGYSR
jgi:hypothetical protein